MKAQIFPVLCGLLAIGCFACEETLKKRAERLQNESNVISQRTLFPANQNQGFDDPRDRQPLWQPDPGVVAQQDRNPTRRIDPNEDLGIQPDPGLVAQQPEAQAALKSADLKRAQSIELQRVGQQWRWGIYVCLGLFVLIEWSLFMRFLGARSAKRDHSGDGEEESQAPAKRSVPAEPRAPQPRSFRLSLFGGGDSLILLVALAAGAAYLTNPREEDHPRVIDAKTTLGQKLGANVFRFADRMVNQTEWTLEYKTYYVCSCMYLRSTRNGQINEMPISVGFFGHVHYGEEPQKKRN